MNLKIKKIKFWGHDMAMGGLLIVYCLTYATFCWYLGYDVLGGIYKESKGMFFFLMIGLGYFNYYASNTIINLIMKPKTVYEWFNVILFFVIFGCVYLTYLSLVMLPKHRIGVLTSTFLVTSIFYTKYDE